VIAACLVQVRFARGLVWHRLVEGAEGHSAEDAVGKEYLTSRKKYLTMSILLKTRNRGSRIFNFFLLEVQNI